jgi:hypothetical protein
MTSFQMGVEPVELFPVLEQDFCAGFCRFDGAID